MGFQCHRFGLVLLALLFGASPTEAEVVSEDVAGPARVFARPMAPDIASAALMMSGQSGGALPIAFGLRRAGPGHYDVRLEIAAPVLDSAEHDIDIMIYLLGQDLEVLAARNFRVPPSPAPGRASHGYRARFRVGATTNATLRLLVRHGEKIALREQILPAPAPRALFAPGFPADDSWIHIEAARVAAAESDHAPGFERHGSKRGNQLRRSHRAESRLQQSAIALLPPKHGARPILRLGDDLSLSFQSLGAPPEQAVAVIEEANGDRLEIPLLDLRPARSQSPIPVPLDAAQEPSPAASDAVHPMLAQLKIPAGLEGGFARLTLHAEGFAPSLPTEIALVAPDQSLGAWPGLGSSSTASHPRVTGNPRLQIPREIKAKLRHGQRQIFQSISEARGLEELVSRLGEIEEGLVADLEPRHLEELGPGLLEILERRLRRLDTPSDTPGDHRDKLFTWAFVQFRLAEEFSQRRRHDLASRAWAQASSTLRRMAALDLPDEAGSLLGLIAHRHQERGRLEVASTLFEEALDLYPEDPLTLYGYALNQERLGEARAASRAFGEVLEKWPDHHEASLRHAVNLARPTLNSLDAKAPSPSNLAPTRIPASQRLDRATERLGKLLGLGGREAWIARLAFQELTRLELTLGRPQQALRRAEQGLARFPDDFNLRLGHARTLDLLRRRGEARQALERLEKKQGSTTSGIVARARYNEWPSEEFERRHQELEKEAEAQLSLLSQAAQNWLDKKERRR